MRGIDVSLCVDVFTTIDLGFPEKIVNFSFVQIFNSGGFSYRK